MIRINENTGTFHPFLFSRSTSECSFMAYKAKSHMSLGVLCIYVL